MRCAVWFSQLGFTNNENFVFPYTAQSPVTGKKKTFENNKDVLNEINNVLNQKGTEKFGIGQTLYYEIPFFTNPYIIISNWCWDMIQDYKLVTNYNVPLGVDLDSISVFKIDCFSIIDQEIKNIKTHREKNG
ncbi:MAG: hypothetical protein Unbinned202contig1002_18 [Prokaryotic dsDNA virus sp.]|nr:MAG: hypothetical protein Unbinned202contig1002_18 [Prokaryotic dsDNA virus sp.]